jgi:alkyldihydroxyacetonephosphate synthase
LSIVDELAGILDPAVIETPDQGPSDWAPRAFLSRRAGDDAPRPECVVRPRTTEEVAAVLEWAHSQRMPVVPFGGATGVCAGVAPLAGAVFVDLRRLDGISDVDDRSRLVTAGAGVTGDALGRGLARHNYMLGHEPQSVAISTVGGWLSTRACGQLSARYGAIEDLVAGLEAVLPGGTVVRSKVAPRRATGPDVANLLIGAEGILGIITEVTLRVVLLPTHRVDRCVRFEHMADGVAACRRLAQSDLQPTLVRLYDAEDAAIFLRHHPGEPQGPVLLLSFDGRDAEARADEGVALTNGTPGIDALVAHWWEHRNDAVEEYRRLMTGEGLLGPHALVDTMEVAGTWSVLRDLYHSIKAELSERAQVTGCHLSHVYADGACLYFTMASMCESDEAAGHLLAEWWDAGMGACLQAGGTISHHHGIGRTKTPYLARELGAWTGVLRAVKDALDPHGIMNPGVLGL